MSWLIYNRELNGFLTNAPDNHTYFSSIGNETRKFKRKKDAKQFLVDNPSHSFPDSKWYNREARGILNEKFLEDVPICDNRQSFCANIYTKEDYPIGLGIFATRDTRELPKKFDCVLSKCKKVSNYLSTITSVECLELEFSLTMPGEPDFNFTTHDELSNKHLYKVGDIFHMDVTIDKEYTPEFIGKLDV